MNTYPYLCDYIQYLETQLQKCKAANQRLKKEANKTLHIDRMEYKIHELNVSTLSGTMNLGVTTQADEETMEQLLNQLSKTGNFNVVIGENEKSMEPENLQHPIETHESTATL